MEITIFLKDLNQLTLASNEIANNYFVRKAYKLIQFKTTNFLNCCPKLRDFSKRLPLDQQEEKRKKIKQFGILPIMKDDWGKRLRRIE